MKCYRISKYTCVFSVFYRPEQMYVFDTFHVFDLYEEIMRHIWERKTNSVKLICTFSKLSIEKIKNQINMK